MQKLLGIATALLLINGIFLFLRSGVGNTFIMNLGILLALGVYTVFFERLKKIKWLNYAIIASLAICLGFGAFVMVYGRRDTVTFTEDVAIVLGAGVRNEEVTRTLRKRLDMAVEYHALNPNALIIVSGGQGPGQTITEAQAMARYLEGAGVPPDIIIQEGGSHSTYENMRLSKAILEEIFPQGFDAVVITNDFHIFRSIRFARVSGMENPTSLHGDTPLHTLPGMLLREIAAIVKMWLIGT